MSGFVDPWMHRHHDGDLSTFTGKPNLGEMVSIVTLASGPASSQQPLCLIYITPFPCYSSQSTSLLHSSTQDLVEDVLIL